MPVRANLPPLSPELAPVLTPQDPFANFPPFRVTTPIAVIGYSERVQVRLRSKQVSRLHAVLITGSSHTFVHDLASRTGTFINDLKVSGDQQLVAGDRLRIGPLTCVVSRELPPVAAPLRRPSVMRFNHEGREIEWEGRVLVIGSRQGANIRVEGSEVSNVHALICRIDGRLFVRDLGSRGGTFLNGTPIRQSEICPGDLIRVGTSTIRFIGGPVAERSALQPAPKIRQAEPTAVAKPARAAGAQRPVEPRLDDDEVPSPLEEWGPIAVAVGRSDLLADFTTSPPQPQRRSIWQRLKGK